MQNLFNIIINQLDDKWNFFSNLLYMTNLHIKSWKLRYNKRSLKNRGKDKRPKPYRVGQKENLKNWNTLSQMLAKNMFWNHSFNPDSKYPKKTTNVLSLFCNWIQYFIIQNLEQEEQFEPEW